MVVVLTVIQVLQYLYDCWPAVQAQSIADALCIRELCLAAKNTVCSACKSLIIIILLYVGPHSSCELTNEAPRTLYTNPAPCVVALTDKIRQLLPPSVVW